MEPKVVSLVVGVVKDLYKMKAQNLTLVPNPNEGYEEGRVGTFMLKQDAKTTQEMAGGGELPTAGAPRPWEDRSASAQERFNSYKSVVISKIEGILESSKREGITHSERLALMEDPATQYWAHEQSLLLNETPKQFCERIDREVIIQELLGKNFLGAEAWRRGFGVDVGEVPQLPKSITSELLESECPLHPGEKIKDTHILVLIPKTVDGKAYSALKLDKLCAGKRGSGDKLIYYGEIWTRAWKECAWAKAAQAQSEWQLLPKSDPDPKKVPEGNHFRDKDVAEQQSVHTEHYGKYRGAKVLEVMTMALLNDLVNGEPRISDGWTYLRCVEPNASGGRVFVGSFDAHGLLVADNDGDFGDDSVGRALARELQT